VVEDWARDLPLINKKTSSTYPRQLSPETQKRLSLDDKKIAQFSTITCYIQKITSVSENRAKQIALLVTQSGFYDVIVPILTRLHELSGFDSFSRNFLIFNNSIKKQANIYYKDNKLIIETYLPFTAKHMAGRIVDQEIFSIRQSITFDWSILNGELPLLTDFPVKIEPLAPALPSCVTRVLFEIESALRNKQKILLAIQRHIILRLLDQEIGKSEPFFRKIIDYANTIMISKSSEEAGMAAEITNIKEILGITNDIANDYTADNLSEAEHKKSYVMIQLIQGKRYLQYATASEIPIELRSEAGALHQRLKVTDETDEQIFLEKLVTEFQKEGSLLRENFKHLFGRLLQLKYVKSIDSSDFVYWEDIANRCKQGVTSLKDQKDKTDNISRTSNSSGSEYEEPVRHQSTSC
jgi:hypothetical protein